MAPARPRAADHDHAPTPVTSPAQVLAVLEQDREVHPYGIADVNQLWEVSQWWLEGDAAVGVLDLPGAPDPVVYAVTARAGDETLALIERLAPGLGEKFVITGPVGLTQRLGRTHRPIWHAPHLKLALRRPDELPAPDPEVTVLGHHDLADLERLHEADPASGPFFHAGLLDTGCYLGIRRGEDLVASAGVHVVDPVGGVAAIGNVATDPAHRRQGLGRRVVASLCHHLLEQVPTVGLNVGTENLGARALYRHLGFDEVADYEEAELIPRASTDVP